MTISHGDWAALASQNERIAGPADTFPEGMLGAIREAEPRPETQDRRGGRAASLLRPARPRRKLA